MSLGLTLSSTPEQVAAALIRECVRRGYSRDESIAVDSSLRQESGLKMVWSPNRKWFGYAQQDAGYPNRMDPNGNLLGFLDRLDAKRKSPGASPDPFKNIFWLQQRPSEKSADAAYNNGRKAYYDEIRRHIAAATADYDRYASGTVPVPPPPAPQTYGMPRGSNSGGYGGNGVRFPDWVYALGDAFGIKPSTYPGHQESNRNEAGYAPNPQGLNRGIDWAAPGAPDQWDRLTRFADYLATIPQHLEQGIWQNPKTMRSIEIAGGRHQPGYFRADLAGHRDHVHTRQSRPIPLPGGAPTPPPPPALRPQFEERQMFGRGASKRSRPPINFLLHTEEGNSTAEGLARYCQGQNNVSYHYTLRDGIVYDVVDTDLASWSVLEANMFTINLCFAGSRAGWSREDWLTRERDIEIAAYLAVQDCRKYNISTEVLVPQWNKQGKDVYAGEPRQGISDHNYVTRELGIGNHTDAGSRFPWDRFVVYVNKYANTTTPSPSGDIFMALNDAEQREMLNYLRWAFREGDGEFRKKFHSRSQVRNPGEGPVDSWAGIDLNSDGNIDLLATYLRAQLRTPSAIARLKRVAAGEEPDRNEEDAMVAQAMLAELAKQQPAQQGAAVPVAAVVDADAIARAVVAAMPAPASTNISQDAQIARLTEENGALREQLGRLQAQLDQRPTPVSLSAELATTETPSTSGDRVGRLVDAVEDFTDLALDMSTKQRAALNASIRVLELPKGSEQE